MSSSSVPVLRAGFGLDFDENDAIANNLLTVILCCFAEVFRSSYAVTHLYTSHQLAKLIAEENETEQERKALIDEHVTLDHLLRGLHHQTSYRNGAVQQIKPLYAFIATHRCMPVDATQLVPREWMQRILTHYDGALACVQRRHRTRLEDAFTHILIEALMTGRNATEIVQQYHREDSNAADTTAEHNDDQEGSESSIATSSEEIDEKEDDDENSNCAPVCDCEFCASVDASHSGWTEWLPADEFDAKIIDLINNIETALLQTVEEI
jgi:hypothetical protein